MQLQNIRSLDSPGEAEQMEGFLREFTIQYKYGDLIQDSHIISSFPRNFPGIQL